MYISYLSIINNLPGVMNGHFLVKYYTYTNFSFQKPPLKATFLLHTIYKHFRKAVAFAFRKLEVCRHCRFRAWSFSGLSSRIRVLAHMPC